MESNVIEAQARPLRVALVVRSLTAPAWLCELARFLASAEGFEPVVVTVGSPVASSSTRSGSVVLRAVGALSRGLEVKAASGGLDPFAEADLTRVVPAVPVVAGSAVAGPDAASLADVAVASDDAAARCAVAVVGLRCPLGVWFSRELAARPAGSPGLLRQGIERGSRDVPARVTVKAIVGPDAVERDVLAGDVSRESLAAARNRGEAAWGAAALVVAALEMAVRRSPGAEASTGTTTAGPVEACGEAQSAGPAPAAAPGLRTSAVARRVVTGVARRVAMRRQWIMAYGMGPGDDLAPTKATHWLVPPGDRFWADPQVVRHNGEYHVFFEELPYDADRAHIATMRLGEDGPIGQPRVALARDYHLSYPHVFTFAGEPYMIPESGQAGVVEAYRSRAFPLAWEPVATLMTDVRAVDTTVFEHGGRWWLFTTIRRLRGESSLECLHLFSADHPLSDEWRPHPCNPVALGVAGGRSAGGVLHLGSRLVRPAQDSTGTYGRRIRLYEIVKLTANEYEEKPFGSLEPNEARGFIGLHTVSRAGPLTIVDLCRWQLKGIG